MNVTNKIKNKAQIAKGQLKASSGGATKHRRLQAEGLAERAAGELKQAGEKAKDAVHSIRH
jgi:uncharacterized protein YjbJ (UPF0337 family)